MSIYTKNNAKSALLRLKGRGVPFRYDLNIYKGCCHGCSYCYAALNSKYLGTMNFKNEITRKTNLPELLDRELSAGLPEHEVINIGGVCDSYQEAEREFKLMPILPHISDDEESLQKLTEWASRAKVSYMLSGLLYLTGGMKKRFYEMLEKEFPHLLKKYQELFPRGGASKDYKTRIHTFLAKCRDKYNVNNSYAKFLPKEKKKQLDLDI